jgi:hypothetical protein
VRRVIEQLLPRLAPVVPALSSECRRDYGRENKQGDERKVETHIWRVLERSIVDGLCIGRRGGLFLGPCLICIG